MFGGNVTGEMTRRKRKWLLIGLAVATGVAVWWMGENDYARLAVRKEPLFARWELHPADGGSTEYRGLGYTVRAVHQIQGITSTGRLYRVGQTLDYWVPFLGRDVTWIIVRTNR